MKIILLALLLVAAVLVSGCTQNGGQTNIKEEPSTQNSVNETTAPTKNADPFGNLTVNSKDKPPSIPTGRLISKI